VSGKHMSNPVNPACIESALVRALTLDHVKAPLNL
jgi:hypothetical protein